MRIDFDDVQCGRIQVDKETGSTHVSELLDDDMPDYFDSHIEEVVSDKFNGYVNAHNWADWHGEP